MEEQAERWIDTDGFLHTERSGQIGRLLSPLWKWARPVLVIAADRTIYAWNEAAENFFRTSGRNLMQGRMLVLPLETAQDRLDKVLTQFAQGGQERPDLVALGPVDASPPLILRTFPLGGSSGAERFLIQIEREDSRGTEISDEFGNFYGLTGAEMKVARTFFQGLDTKAVAERLDCSPHTVKTHLKKIYAKTGAGGQMSLMQKLSKFAI